MARVRRKKSAAQKAADAKRARAALARDHIPRRELGKIVRRLSAHMSREGLAKIVKDAPSQMSRLHEGHDEEFSADRLVGFLRRLGCRVLVTVYVPKLRERNRTRPRAAVQTW